MKISLGDSENNHGFEVLKSISMELSDFPSMQYNS